METARKTLPANANFAWMALLKECPGKAVEPSIFKEQDFLNSTVIKSSFFRLDGMQVLVKDGFNNRKIVKDVVEDCKLLLGDSSIVEIDQIFTNYEEAIKLHPFHLDGVVFLEGLANNPTKIVRDVIKENQHFLYHPPGDAQRLAVVLKNHDTVMQCLLYSGRLVNNCFTISSEEPVEKILVVGSVGMQPLDRRFQIEKTSKIEIRRRIVREKHGEVDEKTYKKINKCLRDFGPMPDCVFRDPSIVGNCEIYEGSVVELLNVRKDSLIQERVKYTERQCSSATSPHFLYATVISSDYSMIEIKVIDGGEETTHRVRLSEGLLYPVGTAERLGATIGGEKTINVNLYMDSVGGPVKYDGKEWRGYAELLMDNEESPYIRPIVIRNIYDGLLVEFSFIDSMESGSILFPLCNPRLLPFGFSKNSSLPVRFNKERVNNQLLENLFTEMRSDRIAAISTDNFLANTIEMREANNPEPWDVVDDIPYSETLDELHFNDDIFNFGDGGGIEEMKKDDDGRVEEKEMGEATLIVEGLGRDGIEMEDDEDEDEERDVEDAIVHHRMEDNEEGDPIVLPPTHLPSLDPIEAETRNRTIIEKEMKIKKAADDAIVEGEESGELRDNEKRESSAAVIVEEKEEEVSLLALPHHVFPLGNEDKEVLETTEEEENIATDVRMEEPMEMQSLEMKEDVTLIVEVVGDGNKGIEKEKKNGVESSTEAIVERSMDEKEELDPLVISLSPIQDNAVDDEIDEKESHMDSKSIEEEEVDISSRGFLTPAYLFSQDFHCEIMENVKTMSSPGNDDSKSSPTHRDLFKDWEPMRKRHKSSKDAPSTSKNDGCNEDEEMEETLLDKLVANATNHARYVRRMKWLNRKKRDSTVSPPNPSSLDFPLEIIDAAAIPMEADATSLTDPAEDGRETVTTSSTIEEKDEDDEIKEEKIEDASRRLSRGRVNVNSLSEGDTTETVKMKTSSFRSPMERGEKGMYRYEIVMAQKAIYQSIPVTTKKNVEMWNETREGKHSTTAADESIKMESKQEEIILHVVPESLALTLEDMNIEKEQKDGKEMLADGIPSGSSNNTTYSKSRDMERDAAVNIQSSLDDKIEEIPSKKSRTSPIHNGVEKDSEREVQRRGQPLDPSFNPFELPPYQAQKMAERSMREGRVGRDGVSSRGGVPREPFIRNARFERVTEKLTSGEEEIHRIKMENVLKELKLLRWTSDKIVDMDILNRDLLKRFRNPLEWNSLEVQLLLDQFDIAQPLKDYVRELDLDGMKLFGLTFKEILNEFPPLDEESDFNEKMFLFSFIDRIKKIANDPEMDFYPPSSHISTNN